MSERSWPTHPDELWDLWFGLKAWAPLQLLALLSSVPLFVWSEAFGELTGLLWLGAGTVAAAVGAFWRLPGVLAQASAALPRIRWDGATLTLPTLAGTTLRFAAGPPLQLRRGTYRVAGGSVIGGNHRGLWLELTLDGQRALLVGADNFAEVNAPGFPELSSPPTPDDARVRTEAAAIVQIAALLDSAAPS